MPPQRRAPHPTVGDNETLVIVTRPDLEPVDDTDRAYAIDVYLRPDGALEVVVNAAAWQERMTQWVVWCPFCGGLHRHGRVENDGETRVAHCVLVEPGSYALHPLTGPRPTRRPTVLAAVARMARRARNRVRSRRRRKR